MLKSMVWSKGFLPKDLEMAATSAIIEKSSKMGTTSRNRRKDMKNYCIHI